MNSREITHSFGQLSIHHEVVDMLLGTSEFQFAGDDRDYESRASSTLSIIFIIQINFSAQNPSD